MVLCRRHAEEGKCHHGTTARSSGTNKRLDALLGYCEAPACRRVALLDYFGEEIEACGNCCCSACVFGADRRANPLTSLKSEGSNFGAD